MSIDLRHWIILALKIDEKALMSKYDNHQIFKSPFF